MLKSDKERFAALRGKVAEMIRKVFEDDCCCKSYEGTWEIKTEYPNYYEDETGTQPPKWHCITLHCYVLGPARHYDWNGKTFSEALDKAEREIDKWRGDDGT